MLCTFVKFQKKKAIVPFRTRSNRSLEECVRYVCKKYRWQLRRKGGWLLQSIKPSFQMSTTIAVIAAMAEKKKNSAISATTISEIELFISQRLLSLQSLERGFI